MNALSKKQKMKQAALEAFIELGFHQTKIDDIVQRAKVGKGTFYLYFSSKEEVVHFLMDEFIEQFNEIHNWISKETEQKSDLQVVYNQEGKIILDLLNKNKNTAKFLLKQGRTVSESIEKRLNDFFNLQTKQASESYRKAIDFGLMDDIDPDYAAFCVVGGITYIYTQWLDDLITDPIDVILEKTLNFYLKALLS